MEGEKKLLDHLATPTTFHQNAHSIPDPFLIDPGRIAGRPSMSSDGIGTLMEISRRVGDDPRRSRSSVRGRVKLN